MCIAIGHSFNSHRILASIGIYVGVSMLSNLASSIFTAFSGMDTFGSSLSLFVVSANHNSLTRYFWSSFWFESIQSIAVGTAAFLLTNYFMSKRLNLE